jgi:hypothetical protein
MTEHEPDVEVKPAGVNPGYAAFQLAKALTTSEEHDDPATRQHAKEKVAMWETVLRNILNGAVDYGSRTPVRGVPRWATLEVVTGGFATGELLAGGPIEEHEQKLLKELARARQGEERLTLNVHFLTDEGLGELRERLRTGCYDVGVPEEGALMVVAWLVEQGYTDEARGLLGGLSPYFTKLRFYPIPLELPRRSGSRVHLQDVGSTIHDLRKIKPNKRILAQQEAVEIWAPLYDRLVGLFLETVEKGWPCQHYSAGWSERAMALLDEYAELRKEHQLCGKPERANGHFAQLLVLLARCARTPKSLEGREVGRIRLILNRYVDKRSTPGSLECVEARRRQLRDVSSPTFHAIVGVIVPRLEKHSKDEGLDDVSHLKQAVSKEESAGTGVPEGTPVPPSVQRKVERCLNETVAVLVDRGLITSAETLARVLPQMTSGLRAAGMSDPALRRLYAAIYRAFRRRRSLLLLNLENQIQIEELPWVAAIDRFRSENLSSRELAKLTLEEVAILTITSFPHMIIPNKLLQELRALVKDADLSVPLVDEVAADIFMGEFSDKFLESAKGAADLLDGTLYATYYGIDYEGVRRIPKTQKSLRRRWFWQTTSPDGFVQLCSSRAGVSLGTWDPAANGMIIEQQQVLTTQNLAALFSGLDLADALRGQLGEMARRCFEWVCRRQQMKIDQWHARLIMVKNTAYAWRQMVFFLALLPDRDVADFLRWAGDHLNAQREEFQNRFRPALKGLALAAEGRSIDSESARQAGCRRFLGWSKARHWVFTDVQNS